jgi:hypothetical protein
MEDAFAESYNNKNTDSIKYYSEDAVSFQMVKCLWKEKSDSWIHEKWITHLPERIKIAFETQKYMFQTMEIW